MRKPAYGFVMFVDVTVNFITQRNLRIQSIWVNEMGLFLPIWYNGIIVTRVDTPIISACGWIDLARVMKVSRGDDISFVFYLDSVIRLPMVCPMERIDPLLGLDVWCLIRVGNNVPGNLTRHLNLHTEILYTKSSVCFHCLLFFSIRCLCVYHTVPLEHLCFC